MDKKRTSFLLFGLSIFAFIFIRAHFVEKKIYKNKLEGILVNKEVGMRGFYDIYIFTKEKKVIKQEYNKLSTYNEIKIGDSVIKRNNSWYVQVYRNFGKGYQFVDSFGIGRN